MILHLSESHLCLSPCDEIQLKVWRLFSTQRLLPLCKPTIILQVMYPINKNVPVLYHLLLSLRGKKYSFKRARWVAPVLTPLDGKTQSDSLVAGSESQWTAGFFLCQLFSYAFTQTHIQIILQSLKTKQDFEKLKISLQSPSEDSTDLLGQRMPHTKYMFGPIWGNSLLGAPCKVLNSKYVLRFHWNHHNGQWTGPQILHRKKVALWLWLLSN